MPSIRISTFLIIFQSAWIQVYAANIESFLNGQTVEKSNLISSVKFNANLDSVWARIEREARKSFGDLVSKTAAAKPFLGGEVTIFAPDNRAMDMYKGSKDSNFVLNHITNVQVRLENLNPFSKVTRLSSVAPGSPSLYITHDGKSYYINSAKIQEKKYLAYSENGDQQRLFVLDKALEPLVGKDPSVADSSLIVDVTAGKLLRMENRLSLDKHRLSLFADRVKELNQFGLFDKPGQSTFFIPVDTAFQSLSPFLITAEILQGHVVPNEILFTNPMTNSSSQTATYSEGWMQIKAQIRKGPDGSAQVSSVTARGSIENPRGETVLANIVKGDIPVSNGIVHLIDKPLVIVANNLWEFFKNERNGTRLSKFAGFLTREGAELKELVSSVKDGTIFAPSDKAFSTVLEDELLKDDDRLKSIIGMHLLDKRIAGDDIRVLQPQNGLGMYGAKVIYPRDNGKKLWMYFKDNDTMYVNGLGVTAEVIERDIGASNGVIHIIDKVLGMPAQSVYKLLEKDPMLSSTFTIGKQDQFNLKFKSEDQQFTYLVPANLAWNDVKDNYLSVHKQLFLGDFGYQSRTILERHLLIGERISADALVDRSQTEDGIQMLRGIAPLKFSKRINNQNETEFIVEWENNEARLIRRDLNCTNGIVHVLDNVIMKRRDVMLSSATMQLPSTSLALIFYLCHRVSYYMYLYF